MERGPVIEALRRAARAVGVAPDAEALRAIQAAQDALDAAKVSHLAGLEESRGFEVDGASSVKTWVCNELRVSARDASALTRAASTLNQLPEVAAAAESGEIRVEHVNVFSYGLRHIGADVVMQSQQWLLDVARTCEPAELRRVMRALREATYPDELDDAWAKGMDKADLQINAVPEGFHVNGFLPIHVGAKFRTVLDSLSAPRDAGDQRTGPERRVDAIDDLCTQILDAGLPSDKGVRPHVSVLADADTVHEAATHQRGTTSESAVPAHLVGFGPIGPELLAMIGCTADVTPILTHQMPDFTQGSVLNVGRAHRLATLKQRRAVHARQDGRCAAPGCTNTHLEIHHVIWWSNGGPTDLDNLIGLCSRCHHLVHRELLLIKTNGIGGFTFADRDNRAIQSSFRHRRAAYQEAKRIHQMSRAVQRRRLERVRSA